MKQNRNHFNIFNREKRDPGTVFLGKIFLALTLAALLLGCTTKVYNIKSPGELSGNKLLTGRFAFFNDGAYIEQGEGFTVFFKETGEKKLRMFQPDEKGYVYIPLNEGQYYISMVEFSYFQGNLRFPVRQSSEINIDASDTVINFGTITVNLQENELSRIGYLSAYAYPYSGKFIPSFQKPELKITQIPEWNGINQYLSSKLNISAESIRDVVLRFPEKTNLLLNKDQ